MNQPRRSAQTHVNSRAVDPRPARTRVMILDAIERLGMQRREINVASVVHEAQLSRSSFYSQFSDLGDVAVQLIRETQIRAAEALDNEQSLPAPRVAVRELVTEFANRRALYSAVLGAGCTTRTINEIYGILARWVQLDMTRDAPAGLSVQYAPTYIAAGVFAILSEWAVEESPCTAAQLEVEILELLPAWLMPVTF